MSVEVCVGHTCDADDYSALLEGIFACSLPFVAGSNLQSCPCWQRLGIPLWCCWERQHTARRKPIVSLVRNATNQKKKKKRKDLT